MSDRIYEAVKNGRYFSSRDRVIAGLSGGADSVCLLHVLARLQKEAGFSLLAVHVHHGIRGEAADRDAAFSESFARSQGIPVKVICKCAPDVSEKQKLSLEEAARKVRYQAFHEAAEDFGADFLALAHHLNDQAETVLFHLIRGSSLKGLSGMEKVREETIRADRSENGEDLPGEKSEKNRKGSETAAEGKKKKSAGGAETGEKAEIGEEPEGSGKTRTIRIVRPLLDITREEILAYLEAYGLSYCEDETNASLEADRNIIRTLVMPGLLQVREDADRKIAETAAYLRKTEAYLEEEARDWIREQGVFEPENRRILLTKEALAGLSEVLSSYVIRCCLEMLGAPLKDISRKHLEAAAAVAGKQNGRRLELPNGVRVTAAYDAVRVSFEKNETGKPAETLGFQIPAAFFEESVTMGGSENHAESPVIEKRRSAQQREGTGVFGGFLVKFELSVRKIGEEPPNLPYTKWFDYAKINEPLKPVFRYGKDGDRIAIGDGRTKKLNRFFIDEKIPREDRGSIPVLAAGSDVLWIVGYRMSEKYKIDENTEEVLKISVVKREEDPEDER
ncbi:MAG: tRNA lysidine(34) synthetase TilS [Lachnospiraceae bacterium]|nr:tRNA lysidine(34) synthetase TilS [Lachnospiraceae bacterium]